MAILPNFLLTGSVRTDLEHAYWTDGDGTGDPFFGFPYQWKITLTVNSQIHSSPFTQTPFEYNGLDVQVGDWIANESRGRAVIITEILTQNFLSIECIVEDYERFNLFNDELQTGSGNVSNGTCIVFRMGDDGLPILSGVPDLFLSFNAINDLEARFLSVNSDEFVLVRQENHNLVVGDLIYPDPVNLGGYRVTDAANIGNALGVVVRINVPSTNYFSYRPLGQLVTNITPPLIGVPGTIFYADPANPGKLTSTRPTTNARPIYLRLDSPSKAILISRPADSDAESSSETYKYEVENVAAGQTIFNLPVDAQSVLYMSINGIENNNFTFNTLTKVLEFDPIETGYGVDETDEVFFIYKS